MNAPEDRMVYFAKCFSPDGHDMNVVKIGSSDDPERRIKHLQHNQPYKCEIVAQMPGDIFMEFFVHRWLREDRVSGEFFHIRGRTLALIDHVKRAGRHPWPIKWKKPEQWFTSLDVVQFMDRHNITMADIRRATGTDTKAYDNLLKKQRCGNRRFLATLAVVAVERGISINWPNDFLPRLRAAA